MAAESTYITRVSHEDNRSLRIIQILTIVFLPASLLASIFGMGFFSTQPGDDGGVVFLVSHKWWIYLAVSVPLTAALLVLMRGYSTYQRNPDIISGITRIMSDRSVSNRKDH